MMTIPRDKRPQNAMVNKLMRPGLIQLRQGFYEGLNQGGRGL